MHAVVGVFSSAAAAERAAKALGLADDQFSVIAPGRREPDETGIGAPLGGAVGGALGAAAGSSLGTAVASMILPGVGPVVATGIVAAVLFGAGGAAIGAAAGDEIEQATEVHPDVPDVFFCEEALRRGRAIVLALAASREQADSIRAKLAAEGAESLEKTRETWWRDLRDSERAVYDGDFGRDEEDYLRGFEAALEPANRGQQFEEHASVSDAYRKGYERGHEYYRRLTSPSA